jgi:dienelactone hydrolase
MHCRADIRTLYLAVDMRRFAAIALGFAMIAKPTHGWAQLLPKPDGPSAVGYWRTTLSTSRPDSLAERIGLTGRTLLIECWYPASGPAASQATKPYMSPPVASALAAQLGLAPGWARNVSTNAVEGARPSGGQHPVVVFSHGLSWPVSLYQALLEDLASKGYVIVAINHPHGAVIDFGGGRVLASDAVPSFPTDSLREVFLAQLTGVWDDDIRATLDHLPRWNAREHASPLSGTLDLARIALVGHSLGGSAVALLSADSRVKAVIALEGQFRGGSETSVTVHAPFLHMIGEYNRLLLENRNYRPSEGASVHQAVIAGTGHAYFSDLMAVYKSSAGPDWLARHRYELEPGRILQITRDYTSAFLARWLSGIDHSLLHPTSYSARVDSPLAAGYAEVRLTIDVR